MLPNDKQEKLACASASIKHDRWTVRQHTPPASAPADKALLFIVRPTRYGGSIQTKLSIDGAWVGVNGSNGYFYVTLDPGTHYFCSQSENRDIKAFALEAGKTYYLQQHISMGFLKATNYLEMLDDAKGKVALGKCDYSLSSPKGQKPADAGK